MTETRMDRMNRRDGALLRKVGDVIAAEPERYDQDLWVTPCGTTACVAGHVLYLHPDFDPTDRKASLVRIGLGIRFSTTAAALCGMRHDEAKVLFDANWRPADDPATPLHERVRDALYALADGATVEEVSA